jgi:hypothetical protein
MIGQWQFDGNLNDSSGLGNNGTAVGTVSYKTGVNNQTNGALYLENISGAQNYVRVTNPVYTSYGANLISYRGSFSLSMWIKPSFVQTYEMYVSTGILPNGWYVSRYWGEYQANCLINLNRVYTAVINDGKWHLLNVVMNTGTNQIALYLDKVFQSQNRHIQRQALIF